MQIVLVFTTSDGKIRSETLVGVRDFAAGANWLVQPITYDGHPFQVKELLMFWKPIGCIVEGSASGTNAFSHTAFHDIPTIYLGDTEPNLPPGSIHVIHDAKSAAILAARELLSLDLDHFAFVGVQNRNWSKQRKDAFSDAIALNKKSLETFDLPRSEGAGFRINSTSFKRWLNGLRKPCGIFAAADDVAQSIISVCHILDIQIPDDLAIVSVDDIESICESTVPTLTSVHPDFRQGGRLAARLLARKILGAKNIPSKTTYSVSSITRRGSTSKFGPRYKDISAALDLIHSPKGPLLAPRDVLKEFKCSRRNAEIRFRSAVGHSILDEIVSVRIELAQKLLKETDLPVSAISDRCGYSFPSCFRTAFHKATGQNPLKWRKQQNAF